MRVSLPLLFRLAVAASLAGLLSGCAVIAVGSAAVSVAATTVSVGAKVVGAAVDAVIPDDDEDDD
jgi:hypothetical protein